MSSLNKFENSESWRERFKKHLFAECNPPVKTVPLVKPIDRFSLDISQDLKTILEKKKINSEERENKKDIFESPLPTARGPLIVSMFSNHKKPQHEKENCMFSGNKNEDLKKFEPHKARLATPDKFDETDYYDGAETAAWNRTSEDSFEAMELMCDKTVSDPNSTLFKYMHSNRKEDIIAEVKKRSTDSKAEEMRDAEEDALKRLLTEFTVDEKNLKEVDVTMIDDIEAPSKLWENTITEDTTILRTSPVKMVGLLRPSTILEENAEDSYDSENSAASSYKTAGNKDQDEVSESSTAYDTATDTSSISRYEKKHKYSISDFCSVSDESSSNTSEKEQTVLKNEDETINLIDLDETLADFKEEPRYESSSEAEDDVTEKVIELSDSEDEKDDNNITQKPLTNTPEKIDLNARFSECYEMESQSFEMPILNNSKPKSIVSPVPEQPQIIDLMPRISTESLDYEYSLQNYEYEHCSGIKQNTSEKSMKFNDTLEEVEYMMKKGMQYMNVVSTTPKQKDCLSPAKPLASSKDFLQSTKSHLSKPLPAAYDRNMRASPKKTFRSALTPTKFGRSPAKDSPRKGMPGSISKTNHHQPLSSRFHLDIKPIPKFNIFKVPSAPTTPVKPKRLNQISHDKFSHVVSPVGTYMRSTTTPLMTTVKLVHKNSNENKADALRELELEARLYKPKVEDFSAANKKFIKLAGVPEITKTLPKKAYISSDLKHIVDERTPITIPGGPKIQKYIEPTLLAAVIRHDGKAKLPDGYEGTGAKPKVPMNSNNSLADLSCMSGDLSLYTVFDAQKL